MMSGAPAEDLVPLGRMLDAPPGTRFVFPAAPLELPFGDARAWWMIDVTRFERDVLEGRGATWTREVPAGLAAAREKLVALLAALAAPRLVLGGFSQGAMLACDVALRDARPLAGLALMSPTVVAEDEWAPRFASRRGLPVFVSHGVDDPLLPYAVARRLADEWRAAGAEVDFVRFRGGHAIPSSVLEALGAFLRKALA
jgi:phospholipase/carboxylesterase